MLKKKLLVAADISVLIWKSFFLFRPLVRPAIRRGPGPGAAAGSAGTQARTWQAFIDVAQRPQLRQTCRPEPRRRGGGASAGRRRGRGIGSRAAAGPGRGRRRSHPRMPARSACVCACERHVATRVLTAAESRSREPRPIGGLQLD